MNRSIITQSMVGSMNHIEIAQFIQNETCFLVQVNAAGLLNK